jgi:hypothetical protein
VRLVSAAEIEAVLKFPALIDAIADAFRANIAAPLRHHHAMPREDVEATLLLMPAWTGAIAESFIGTKIVTVFPTNPIHGRASVNGTESGEPLAAIDGSVFTLWRTAAFLGARGAFFSARRRSARALSHPGVRLCEAYSKNCDLEPHARARRSSRHSILLAGLRCQGG